MIISPRKTRKVTDGSGSLTQLLDESLNEFKNSSVLAITSKVVAICEGRVAPLDPHKKEELVKAESDYWLPPSLSKYGFSFTITNHTLVPVAGIDESNGDGKYVLWPKNPQKSANEIRQYLVERFGLNEVGVVITDSTARPLHYGTEGVSISFSGFLPLNDYIGQPDLFGRPFKVSMSNIADGLAAAAVLAMGEGTEQTPLAVIEDIDFVQFVDRAPTKHELGQFYLDHDKDDLFAPFLKNAPWQKGDRRVD